MVGFVVLSVFKLKVLPSACPTLSSLLCITADAAMSSSKMPRLILGRTSGKPAGTVSSEHLNPSQVDCAVRYLYLLVDWKQRQSVANGIFNLLRVLAMLLLTDSNRSVGWKIAGKGHKLVGNSFISDCDSLSLANLKLRCIDDIAAMRRGVSMREDGEDESEYTRGELKQMVEDSWPDASKFTSFTAAVEVPFPAAVAFDLYSDLEQHVRWSPWLEAVQFERESGMSTWTLKTRGFRFSWQSLTIEDVRPTRLSWRSISGLKNSGLVTFAPVGEAGTRIELKLSARVPAVFRTLLKAGVVERFVVKTIKKDLIRFRDILRNEST